MDLSPALAPGAAGQTMGSARPLPADERDKMCPGSLTRGQFPGPLGEWHPLGSVGTRTREQGGQDSWWRHSPSPLRREPGELQGTEPFPKVSHCGVIHSHRSAGPQKYLPMGGGGREGRCQPGVKCSRAKCCGGSWELPLPRTPHLAWDPSPHWSCRTPPSQTHSSPQRRSPGRPGCGQASRGAAQGAGTAAG